MSQRQASIQSAALPPSGGRASDYCTVSEVAALLGVSVSTVWRWVDSGKLAAYRIGPKAIRIRRSDAEAAIRPIKTPLEAPGMNSVFVDGQAATRPLSGEEKERGLAALADAEQLGEEILARRKGKPLPDSAAIIRASREERSRRI